MQSGAQPAPRFLITSYAAGVRINREIWAAAEADEKAAAAAAAAGNDRGDGAKKATATAPVSRFGFSFRSAAVLAPAKNDKTDFLL